MAEAIVEAPEIVEEGGAALERTAARRTGRAPRAAGRAQRQPPARRQPAQRRQPAKKGRAKGFAVDTGRGAVKARAGGQHSYQSYILAEFLVAIILVAVSPLASGGTATAKAKGSGSPYDVNSLKQLVAIGLVYFVLGLFGASQKVGRWAAWFGGLVLLGLGAAQYLNGDLQGFFDLFGPAGPTGSNTSSGGGSGTPLSGPLFNPGAPAADQQAAQNALNPQITSGGATAPPVDLIDSGTQPAQNLING